MTASKVTALVVALATSAALAEPIRRLDESIEKKNGDGGNVVPPLPICSFSTGTSTDIYGTGMDGGTLQSDLSQCQAHCSNTAGCQAAQFSAGAQRYNGRNCFIYDSQDNTYPIAAGINQFLLYKCTRHQTPSCDGYWCGPYYSDIDGTGIDGGSSQWDWAACQSHCANTGTCKAAQYSADQTYAGNNCFLYNNQNPNQPQLENFLLYYYNGHNAFWGEGLARDIDGTGLGGSWANTLADCKARCKATGSCQAAQWSATSQFEGSNCFIYDTSITNAPQFMDFKLYKYRRDGCGDSMMCSRLYSDDAAHWVEDGKENSITNLALPVFLPIAAVVGVVGAVGIARRVRASQRTVTASAEDEEMEVLQ